MKIKNWFNKKPFTIEKYGTEVEKIIQKYKKKKKPNKDFLDFVLQKTLVYKYVQKISDYTKGFVDTVIENNEGTEDTIDSVIQYLNASYETFAKTAGTFSDFDVGNFLIKKEKAAEALGKAYESLGNLVNKSDLESCKLVEEIDGKIEEIKKA